MTIVEEGARAASTVIWAQDPRVQRLRSMALAALPRMYLPEKRTFCFRVRPDGEGIRCEGTSNRYTAMALIGLLTEPADATAAALRGHDPADVIETLVRNVAASDELGEVAMALWCARAWEHPGAARALDRLRALSPHERGYRTVETSWALTSQVFPGSDVRDEGLVAAVAARLRRTFDPHGNLFRHWPEGAPRPWLRAHVACFADLVYPIQAFSYHHAWTGDEESLRLAQRCAAQMCAGQGPAGQWWWHFDTRTGRRVEKYPVYAVHQDAMGPMALFSLAQVVGASRVFDEAVERSLAWLESSPELGGGSLIDARRGIIWRKVFRHEPGRTARLLQTVGSRLHPGIRVPAVDALLRPGRVDWESRPYHMGWILHAFPPNR